jgi:hypothetical protein
MPLKRALRAMLPGRAYSEARKHWHHYLRLKKEGVYTAFERRRLWPRILVTPPVYTDPSIEGSELCVHLMCYQSDYLAAIWCLKSFYHHAKNPLPLTIHIQGQSTAIMEKGLREHFPNARFILQGEADAVVERQLRSSGCLRLLEMRRAIPTVQKLTDFLTFATARRILILDSDVLFFGCPKELIDFDRNTDIEFLVQRDFMDAYTISPARARSELGIDLQPAMNVGIVRLTPGIIDFAKCEKYLAHPEFAQLEGHTEQTLWALEVSRQNAVSYLPGESYFISEGGPADCGVLKARHYAGLSRRFFTREGIPFLIRSGFLANLQKATGPSQPAVAALNH